jgi:Ca-activated chloride channel family protein
MLRLLIIGLVVVISPVGGRAITLRDDMNSNVSRGNRYYEAGEHNKALQRYQEAQQVDSTSAVPYFNSGDALFRLGNYRDGALEFLRSASSETDTIKAMSYYNLGNTMFRAGDLRSAAEAYRRSLLIDPEDPDAKYNLELALRMIEQQEQQQDQQQQEDQQQDQQQQDQGRQDEQQQDKSQQDQQEQDQQEQEQQQQDQQQQDQQQEQENRQPQQGQTPPEISPEELERILAAIEASDRKTQEEMMQKASRRKVSKGKDW